MKISVQLALNVFWLSTLLKLDYDWLQNQIETFLSRTHTDWCGTTAKSSLTQSSKDTKIKTLRPNFFRSSARLFVLLGLQVLRPAFVCVGPWPRFVFVRDLLERSRQPRNVFSFQNIPFIPFITVNKAFNEIR